MIKQGLEAYEPENNRSQILKTKKGEIILDAYNANPTSMKGALENLSEFEGQKVAILGDMFELGSYEEAEHKTVAKQCAELGVKSYLCGAAFSKHSKEFPNSIFSLDREALVGQLKSLKLQDGYHVLIKGSRGMALEKIVDELEF